MRKLIPLMILMLSASIFAQKKTVAEVQAEIAKLENKGDYEIKYDKFKDETEVRVRVDIMWKNKELYKQRSEYSITGVKWHLISDFKGEGVGDTPRSNSFCSYTISREWAFLRDREMILLLDGERINLTNARRSGEAERGYVWEFLCWDVETDFIKKLAQAKKVEFQVGRLEGPVREEKFPMFTNFAKLIGILK